MNELFGGKTREFLRTFAAECWEEHAVKELLRDLEHLEDRIKTEELRVQTRNDALGRRAKEIEDLKERVRLAGGDAEQAEQRSYRSSQRAEEERDRRIILEGQLAELLAVIHRDGGHYLEEHGMTKACADAMIRVPNERVVTDRLRTEMFEARVAAAESRAGWQEQQAMYDEAAFTKFSWEKE